MEYLCNYRNRNCREQHVREGDDFISTLDPSKTEKISFQSYVRDNYGDLNIDELEKKDKSDLRSRETRRVRDCERIES